MGEGTSCQTRRLQEAGRGALRRMLGCSPSPSSPLRGLCHQGYPLPSPGWRQPARQRPHCQLVHISSAWRERSKGASERETEPKGTCPPTQADLTSPPAPPPRLHQPAQARGQAPLLGGGWGGERRSVVRFGQMRHSRNKDDSDGDDGGAGDARGWG